MIDAIHAIPAHAPADSDESILTAKIIAHQASESAMYFAARMEPSYHNYLTRIDLLVSLGMLDAEYAERITQETKTTFESAIASFSGRNRQSA